MRLTIKSGEAAGEIKEQEIFMGDFPMMTENGTFIINGAERVVVSQLVRSPGVYFTVDEDPSSGRRLCMGKLIPSRGAWLEFETSNKRRAVGEGRPQAQDPDHDAAARRGARSRRTAASGGHRRRAARAVRAGRRQQDHKYIDATIDRDPTTPPARRCSSSTDACGRATRRTRITRATLLNSLFFNFRRYDLGRVGRYKVNKRLAPAVADHERILTADDLIEIVREMIRLNNGRGRADDIDHLGNRRVRAVGELIQNQFRVGLLRMERVVKERMSITDPATATPSSWSTSGRWWRRCGSSSAAASSRSSWTRSNTKRRRRPPT